MATTSHSALRTLKNEAREAIHQKQSQKNLLNLGNEHNYGIMHYSTFKNPPPVAGSFTAVWVLDHGMHHKLPRIG